MIFENIKNDSQFYMDGMMMDDSRILNSDDAYANWTDKNTELDIEQKIEQLRARLRTLKRIQEENQNLLTESAVPSIKSGTRRDRT